MKHDSELNRYAASGMAAYLPGMQYMIELMQHELDEFRNRLALLQEMKEPVEGRKRGRPKGSGGSYGWEGMTPEERSAEMKRRMQVHKRKLLVTHPDHPDHAKWVAKMARLHRAVWAKKTKAEKEAWKAKMAAGKVKAAAKKHKPAVALAAAS